MADQDDVLHLIEDSGPEPEASTARRWKIAVIDDDHAVHEGTRFALSDYVLNGQGLGEGDEGGHHVTQVVGDRGQRPFAVIGRDGRLVVDADPLAVRHVVVHDHLFRAHRGDQPDLERVEPADMKVRPHAQVGVVEPEIGDVFVLRVNVA